MMMGMASYVMNIRCYIYSSLLSLVEKNNETTLRKLCKIDVYSMAYLQVPYFKIRY
jgi:hypothetical protein